MDYQFENLGFERFQEVCQSLLVREFPSVQCFPVGQPDGGRDAIRFLRGVSADDFIVYQVKFARRPQAIEAPHKWLVDTIEEELPKIRKLIPKGASAYYLLTNVSGTAHPDAGSIDILNGMLTTSIDIPSHCWWRDDLNRRLDNAWDVKWSYPELLSGPDMLRMIVESGLSEDRERRTAAIKSFVRDQFDRDQEVRFKQVDLQSNLLDLFIDVPIHSGDQAAPRRRHAFHLGLRYIRQFQGMPEEIFETREEAAVGAATLLLSTEAQEHMPHIVLEGAPGQGKSTIVQYIAQIHRRRILGESVDFPSIPPTHRICPVRLPFKIDLRDLATWLTKKDPFSAADEQDAPVDWEKSLEAFMAAQVRHHSGGMAFSTTDLIAVARFSSLLVVFDGLDEVASVSRRQEVVEVIQRGLHRLKDHSVSLQAIVTSRPAAFANSPGLSEQEFTYLELGAITRPLINEYANRWIAAKHLDSRESREVRSILKDKLDQPHLRELARNPMQLTILLNLIHTRGASLPDKRTALYDSYMETFFNREAEKSAIVREHRDLLIDIHRYLAWILHSEAETRDNRGSIPTDRLKALISQYLAEEEHDFSLSERLFTGMVERVVALVSRVEGMFEFEVQPLREYFAARYLYDTAPYSPPGAERRGTRPERFAAIAKNPYWFNVARFYAGCYSKGELASLVDGLDDLATSDGYKFTNHPHTLAATLLADWVFAQQPKSIRQVVNLLLDGVGLRRVLNMAGARHRRYDPLVLPQRAGNEELISRCFEILNEAPPWDFASSVVELIRSNATDDERMERWRRAMQASVGADRVRWMRYGLALKTLPSIYQDELRQWITDCALEPELIRVIIASGHSRYLESDESRCETAVDVVLDASCSLSAFSRPHSMLELLAQSLDARRYAGAFESHGPIPLLAQWRHRQAEGETWDKIVDESANSFSELPISAKAKRVILLSADLASRTTAEWAREIEPWSILVESARAEFGERRSLLFLAVVGAAIRSKTVRCDSFSELFDHSKPLCYRVRYARLRAGSASWWENRFHEVQRHSYEETMLSLVMLAWAGPTVLSRLASQLDDILCSLGDAEWEKIAFLLRRALRLTRNDQNGLPDLHVKGLPNGLSERTAVALSYRTDNNHRRCLFDRYCAHYSGRDRAVVEFSQEVAIRRAIAEPSEWDRCLAIIERGYSLGVSPPSIVFHPRRVQQSGTTLLPAEIARNVVAKADKYPADLVVAAEWSCRRALESLIEPVGTIAEREAWFNQ